MAQSLVEANLRGVDSHGVQLLNFYIEHMAHAGAWSLTTNGNHRNRNPADHDVRGRKRDRAGRSPTSAAITRSGWRRRTAWRWCRCGIESFRGGGVLGAKDRARRPDRDGVLQCDAAGSAMAGKRAEVRDQSDMHGDPWCSGDRLAAGHGDYDGGDGKNFQGALQRTSRRFRGWAFDSEGVPTTDTAKALKGMPMPLGGYKGSGLASWWRSWWAVLSGGSMSTEVGGVRIRTRPMSCGQVHRHRCGAIHAGGRVQRADGAVDRHGEYSPPILDMTKCWWRGSRNGATRVSGVRKGFLYRGVFGRSWRKPPPR